MEFFFLKYSNPVIFFDSCAHIETMEINEDPLFLLTVRPSLVMFAESISCQANIYSLLATYYDHFKGLVFIAVLSFPHQHIKLIITF